MSRRVVTYILFGAVAIYGTGLPQLVHFLVDHQGWGWGGAAASAHSGCCSHVCSATPQDSADENADQHDGCDDSHDCDVCAMLGSTHAETPSLVKVLRLCDGSPDLAGAAPHTALLSSPHGPQSPRGPPGRI